jgi:hypothetical protein
MTDGGMSLHMSRTTIYFKICGCSTDALMLLKPS